MRSGTGQKVLRATSVVGAFSVLVAVLGFLKNLIAAYYFGTTRAMDVYLLALVIPDLAQYLSITGLFNFIPLFAKARAEGGEEAGWRIAGKLVTLWLLVLITLVAVCVAGAFVLSWLVAPGLEPQVRGLYVLQTRLLCLMALSVGAARVLAAVHNARKRFFVPSLGEAAFQIGSIVYILLFHGMGTLALVGGMVFGGFCQLLVSALDLSRVTIAFDFDTRDPAVGRMVRQSVPVYVANAAAKFSGLVSSAFASTLSAGQLSALQYGGMPVDMLATTIGLSLSRALLPFLAQQHAEGRRDDLTRIFDRGIVATVLVILPASAGLWLLARPTVRLLFERGSFDAQSTELTVAALQIYSPLLLAVCLNHILATLYYAQNDTLTPTRVGLVRVALAVLLCALLVPGMGLRGLALAATLGESVKVFLMMAAVRGEAQRRALRSALRSCARLLPAVFAMSAVVYPLSRLEVLQHFAFRPGPVAALLGTVLSGTLTYVVAVRVLSRSDFDYFYRFARAAVGLERRGAEAG